MLTRPDTGVFLTLEGIDGCGKSTQAHALAAALEQRGHKITLTREPGGSAGAEEIRRLLVAGSADRWSAETEILLFNAARRDHLERTILPALARDEIVICDRFADSTRVYQGAARGDLRSLVDRLHDLVIGLDPDLTFVIDMDPAAALARGLARGSGEDRFEELGLEFHARLRAGFVDLARQNSARITLVDGNRAADAVSADLMTRLHSFLDRGR